MRTLVDTRDDILGLVGDAQNLRTHIKMTMTILQKQRFDKIGTTFSKLLHRAQVLCSSTYWMTFSKARCHGWRRNEEEREAIG